MELVEGKDSPSQIVPKFSNEGKTVGLLLRVLEPIFAKGMVVIIDSGFCVEGNYRTQKTGCLCICFDKKSKYWPKHIKGVEIKAHFDGKDVGDCDSWKGMMEEVPFHVYAMTEPDYVMLLMSTYGTNLRQAKKQVVSGWIVVA